MAVILCANILAAGYVERQNLQAIDTEQNQLNTRQYQMLAHSLAEGKTWLMVEPDEMLKSLSNPYDYRLRSMTLEPAGVSYLWTPPTITGVITCILELCRSFCFSCRTIWPRK